MLGDAAAVLVVGAEAGLLLGQPVAQDEDLGHLAAAVAVLLHTTPMMSGAHLTIHRVTEGTVHCSEITSKTPWQFHYYYFLHYVRTSAGRACTHCSSSTLRSPLGV